MNLYGLIGHPLTHSFSAKFFNKKFCDEHIEARYQLVDIPSPELINRVLYSSAWSGLNVTIPYKQSIIPHLHSLHPAAAEIGAVNCIQFLHHPDGSPHLRGYNTDAMGFRSTLLPHLHPHHRSHALILGSGGASRAVQYTLRQLSIPFTIASRHTSSDTNAITYDLITPDLIASTPLIINTTPLGMYPDNHTYPPLPYQAITRTHLLYDLVYNPDPTQFLIQGSLRGGTTVSGIHMLYAQALAAYDIWTQPHTATQVI